jgi:hypothetical protein
LIAFAMLGAMLIMFFVFCFILECHAKGWL